MGKGKTHVFLVKVLTGNGNTETSRLIRGTLREVEDKLRQEVHIEPCSADQAHALHDVQIEEAGE